VILAMLIVTVILSKFSIPVLSLHTLVLVMFCFFTFVEDTCCGIAGIMNVKKRKIGSVMWIWFIVAGKVLNAFLCTVLTGLQLREL
jgi:hypothetical protein